MCSTVGRNRTRDTRGGYYGHRSRGVDSRLLRDSAMSRFQDSLRLPESTMSMRQGSSPLLSPPLAICPPCQQRPPTGCQHCPLPLVPPTRANAANFALSKGRWTDVLGRTACEVEPEATRDLADSIHGAPGSPPYTSKTLLLVGLQDGFGRWRDPMVWRLTLRLLSARILDEIFEMCDACVDANGWPGGICSL